MCERPANGVSVAARLDCDNNSAPLICAGVVHVLDELWIHNLNVISYRAEIVKSKLTP